MKTLTITRGIPLYFDQDNSKVYCGRMTRATFSQVPLYLWFTFQADGPLDHAMIVNVSRIKQAVKDALAEGRTFDKSPALLLLDWSWQVMAGQFTGCSLVRIELYLNESLILTRHTREDDMLELTTKYDLAASHRLACPDFDDTRNEAIYGKCANPSGHGHNYQLEVTLSGRPDSDTGLLFPLERLDQIVHEFIIEPFDHKNLNIDTAEFKNCIPTVENMIQVFYRILQDKFSPARLSRLRLWETSKTYAEYVE